MKDDLTNLILVYSKRGITNWKRTEKNFDFRTKAEKCLPDGIADKEWQIHQALDNTSDKRIFIPMPRSEGRCKGFEWCFFSPKKTNRKWTSLILFILVKSTSRNCIAFRFEETSPGRHGYNHLQLTKKWKDLDQKIDWNPCVPDWLPDSYPAFPIPAKNWTEMFLAMMTAVHGYRGGVEQLIDDMFTDAGRLDDARRYTQILQKMLSKD